MFLGEEPKLSTKFVLKGVFVYMTLALVVLWIISTTNDPKNFTVISVDDCKALLAGFSAYAATACWLIRTTTVAKTWEYTYYWACSFVFTLVVGMLGFLYLNILSPGQWLWLQVAVSIGMLIGIAEVNNALDRQDQEIY